MSSLQPEALMMTILDESTCGSEASVRVVTQPSSVVSSVELMKHPRSLRGKQYARRCLPLPQKDPRVVFELERKRSESLPGWREIQQWEIDFVFGDSEFGRHPRAESPFLMTTDDSSDEAASGSVTKQGKSTHPVEPKKYPPILTDAQLLEKPKNFILVPTCTCRYIVYDGHIFSHLRRSDSSNQTLRCRARGCLFGGRIDPTTDRFEEIGKYHRHKRPSIDLNKLERIMNLQGRLPSPNYSLISKILCTYCPIKIIYQNDVFISPRSSDPINFECEQPGCDAYGRLYGDVFEFNEETSHNHPPTVNRKSASIDCKPEPVSPPSKVAIKRRLYTKQQTKSLSKV